MQEKGLEETAKNCKDASLELNEVSNPASDEPELQKRRRVYALF